LLVRIAKGCHTARMNQASRAHSASPPPTSPPGPPALVGQVVAIARAAGAAILPHYRSVLAVDRKADRSPVTAADRAADAVIVPALEALTPGVPIVSEERVERAPPPESLAAARFWLVDPLDGTKEFIAERGEFTVNIGLVERGRPVFGVVLAPVSGTAYAGLDGQAWRIEADGGARPIRARTPPEAGLVVAHSRSHANWDRLDRFLDGVKVAERVVSGSAVKFGLVAEGAADLYPRFGPTSEWDTAAGQAVLEAAGGSVRDHDGRPLTYGKPGFLNPGFVARGRT
jgi:3'(2'), 5'-bisphosphate nucleotidase